jgi:phytanoyl-CoA hydroxylase
MKSTRSSARPQAHPSIQTARIHPSTGVTTAALFTAEELDGFRRDGFVVARSLGEPGLCEQLKTIARDHLARQVPPVEYEADLRYPGAPLSRDAEGGRTVRRLLQACSRAAPFRDWATSPLLRRRLAQLLGDRVVLVQTHHNCVMTKHPQFGSLTGWHQDIRYWSFEQAELVSVWLALGPEREENGGLWLVPGSHALQLDRARFDEALFLREDLESNRAVLSRRVPMQLERGDVLFFHCRLLHAAGRNLGSQIKYSAVFTYCSAQNHPIANSRSASLPPLALD